VARDPLDALFDRAKTRDEVLQVLFWLAGEGFESEMTADGVARFTARTPEEVRPALDEAVALGLALRVEDPAPRYMLTEAGRREGGRRFANEFAEVIQREGHGSTCSDPDCDCHASPEAASLCHETTGRRR
jgi:hypothetical protein